MLANFVRTLTSLDQTLAIFKPEFKREHGLRTDIADSLIMLNQSLIPLVNETTSALTKTQQLTKRQVILGVRGAKTKKLPKENL